MSKIRGLLRVLPHPKDALKKSDDLFYASIDCIGDCGETLTAVFANRTFATAAGPGKTAELFASYGWTVAPDLCPICRVKKIIAANEALLRGLAYISYPSDDFRRWFVRLADSLSRDDRGDRGAVILAETARNSLLEAIANLQDIPIDTGAK